MKKKQQLHHDSASSLKREENIKTFSPPHAKESTTSNSMEAEMEPVVGTNEEETLLGGKLYTVQLKGNCESIRLSTRTYLEDVLFGMKSQ